MNLFVVADPIIDRGMLLAAAAKTLGLTPDEAMAIVARGQAKAAKRRGVNIPTDQVIDGFIKRAAGVAEINADMPADIDEFRTIPNAQLQYGEQGNQDALQNFGGINNRGQIDNEEQAAQELERARDKKDPNVISRMVFDKKGGEPRREEIFVPDGMPVPREFREAAMMRDFGVFQKDRMAPAAQIMGAEKARLQQGINKFGADAFPGIANVVGRLEDDIEGGRGAERALARELVQRDGQRFDENVAFRNNQRNFVLAQDIAARDFQINGKGAAADAALARIGTIGKLGHALYPTPNDTQVTRAINPGDAANAPIPSGRLVGPLNPGLQFVAQNMPGFREGGAFNDFPQVGINAQLDAARNALQQAKFNNQGIDFSGELIRNADDLQAAADEVVALGRREGAKFFVREGDKNVPIANPGIREMLQRGGMNPREVGNVAAALFQIEAARKNPLNEGRKELFDAGAAFPDRPVAFGGQHPMLGGGEAEIARLRGEKIKGKEVKAQLQALDGRKGNPGEPLNAAELKQARMPFIGAVAGEEVPRAQFVRGDARGLNKEALVRRFGPVNGLIANRILERYEQQQGSQSDGFGLGGDAYVKRQIALRQDVADHLGRSKPSVPNFLAEGQVNHPVIKRGPNRREAVVMRPGRDENAGAEQRIGLDVIKGANVQAPAGTKPEIQERRGFVVETQKNGPAIPSGFKPRAEREAAIIQRNSPIATDPWTETVATGRGITSGSAPVQAKPQAALPYGIQTNGERQGPKRGDNFMFKADGPGINTRVRDEGDYLQSVRNLGRIRRVGRDSAIVGGAALGLAGIDGLINGERNRREKEVIYQ